MMTRIVQYLSLGACIGALALVVGCPLMQLAGSSNQLGDGLDTRPTPGAPGECLIDVVIEGRGDVDVVCNATGTLATLTATPAEGFRFDRFVGAASNSNVITVATGSGVTVTAVFVSLTEDVPDDVVTTPGNANDNGQQALNENDNQNQNVNDNGNQNGNDNGDATQLLEVVVVGGLGSGLYNRDEVVTITAIVPTGKQFDKWVGDTEHIISGTVTSAVIQVRVTTNISLIATFVPAPTTAHPPTISISIQGATVQPPPIFTVFDRNPITILIDAEVFEGPDDRVEVFVDRDGLFDPSNPSQVRDEIFIGSGFSFTTSMPLDVTILEKGVSYAVGAFVSDGLNATVVDYASYKVRRSTLPPTYWVGSISPPPGAPAQSLSGLILEGVNVEDNAGSDFTGGADFTRDGVDDFVVVARYAKPDFVNPSGVGIGEAYLIAGSTTRRTGKRNLNATSSTQLPGSVFKGIDTGFFNDQTDGLSAVLAAPDIDGDGTSELFFGVPFSASAGNAGILDKPGQFTHGGVIMVSSKTTEFGAFTNGTRILLDVVGQWFTQREMWGKDLPVPEPENNPLMVPSIAQSPCFVGGREGPGEVLALEDVGDDHIWYVDALEYSEGAPPDPDDPEDFGECAECVPGTDGFSEMWIEPRHGFAHELVDTDFVFSRSIDSLIDECGRPEPCPANGRRVGPIAPAPASVGCPLALVSLGAGASIILEDPLTPSAVCECAGPPMVQNPDCPPEEPTSPCTGGEIGYFVGSGYYPDQIYNASLTEEDRREFIPNDPISPFGARVIGKDEDDRFGTSITISRGSGSFFVVASAPNRTGSVAETPALLTAPSLQEECRDGSGCQFGIASCDNGQALCGAVPDSGVAYLFFHRNYWEAAPSGRVPPKPHQYLVDKPSYFGEPNPRSFMQVWDVDGSNEIVSRPQRRTNTEFATETPGAALTIVGREDENIEVLAGIPDINLDTRDDLAIGAPHAGTNNGALYIIYRRSHLLEGDYVLEKLTLDLNDPIRLDGAFITGSPQNGVPGLFGSSIAGDLDLNNDNIPDLVVGAPGIVDPNTGTGDPNGNGEVVVIFGGSVSNTPVNGLTVNELISRGEAVRIKGMHPGGQFGFNVANAGDVDGDGRNDLLVSAPAAWPVFDNDPFDSLDQVSAANFGLDLNHNGQADDITGPAGKPDGSVDNNDRLLNAGLVYLILGSNNLGSVAGGTVDIADLGKSHLQGAIFVGRRGDRNNGAIKGDFLGGGDAGNTNQGGNPAKSGRFGRSRGLAGIGDIDRDGKDDIILGSILADVRLDAVGNGVRNAGEAYVIYGFQP